MVSNLWQGLAALFAVASLAHPAGAAAPGERLPTPRDAVELTLAREPGYYQSQAIYRSGDGKAFLVLTNTGNLANNSRTYVLRRFEIAQCLVSCRPEIVASATSLDGKPAISQVEWTEGGNAILFLRHEGKEPAQLVRLARRRVHILTRSKRGVIAYAYSRQGRVLVYAEAAEKRPLFADEQARLSGLKVTDQSLLNLILGRATDYEGGEVLVVVQNKSGRRSLLLPAGTDATYFRFGLSPDGDTLAFVRSEPSTALPDADLFPNLKNTGGRALTWWSVSLQSGTYSRILDGPVGPTWDKLLWSIDGRRVVVETYLPGQDVPSLQEVDVGAHRIVAQVSEASRPLLAWDGSRESLLLGDGLGATSAVVHMFRDPGNGTWRRSSPQINSWQPVIAESPTDAPRLQLRRSDLGETILLWEMNPQVHDLALGTVTKISVSVPGQVRSVACGVFLPQGYVSGKRYPLVIQTHGWEADRFQLDGVSSAGYGAQFLAARGFVVVQSDFAADMGTVREGQSAADLYDAIIDELDRRGLIDPQRVGLQAWSRTGYGARVALNGARHKFGAAVLVDSMAGGYGEYLAAENEPFGYQAALEALTGSAPFGNDIEKWVQRSPPFQNAKRSTPTMLFAFGPSALLGAWEDYTTLRHLDRVVTLNYYPITEHAPSQPADRVNIETKTVDWFVQWLKPDE